MFNAPDDVRVLKRLVEEAGCSRCSGALLVSFLDKGGHEYDWHDEAARSQRFAQGKAVHPGHLYICDHAGNVIERCGLQQFLPACVEFHGKVTGAQELSQSMSDGSVVVDDRNHGGGSHTRSLSRNERRQSSYKPPVCRLSAGTTDGLAQGSVIAFNRAKLQDRARPDGLTGRIGATSVQRTLSSVAVSRAVASVSAEVPAGVPVIFGMHSV